MTRFKLFQSTSAIKETYSFDFLGNEPPDFQYKASEKLI